MGQLNERQRLVGEGDDEGRERKRVKQWHKTEQVIERKESTQAGR